MKYKLSIRLVVLQHRFWQNIFFFSFCRGAACLWGDLNACVHQAFTGQNQEQFPSVLRIMRGAVRGVIWKSSLVVFTFFGLVQLIYPWVNTLDTKLSVSISSGYWVCQFYLSPFELQRNEFKSRVHIRDGSFKKLLTGSMWFKSILFKSGSKLKLSLLKMKSSSVRNSNLSV